MALLSETQKRKNYADQARASALIEGIPQTDKAKSLSERYVNGEITISQAIKKARAVYSLEP